MMRNLCMLTLIALVNLALTGPLVAQPAPADNDGPDSDTITIERIEELLEEGEPAFTQEQADQYAKQIVPLLEKAAGAKFAKPPTVKLTDRDVVARSLADDLAAQFESLLPDLSPRQRRRQARAQAEAMTPTLLGKYGVKTKVLYLMPRNFEPLLKLSKVDARHSDGVLQLIIAHELTHALQDQQIDLGKALVSIKGLDANSAFNATIEGHAMLMQDLVCKALGLDDTVRESAKLFAAGSIKLDDPFLQMLNKIIEAQYQSIYVGGRKFMAYHYERGGTEKLWEILAAPPASTSMIAAPATYSPVRAAKIDYASVLKGIEKEFGDTRWKVQNMELGHMALNAAYANMGKTERQQAISRIRGAQAMIAVSANGEKVANVSIFELKDDKDAAWLISTIETMAEKNIQILRDSPGGIMTLENAEMIDFKGAKGDVAREIVMTVSGGGERVTNRIIRVSRGTAMLEMMIVNIDMTDKQAGDVLEKVFGRIEAARKASEKAPPASQPSADKEAA